MPLVSGTFAATGQSATLNMSAADGTLSLVFAGTATVKLQRSFDKGATWKDMKTYTANAEENFFEPCSEVQYRLNCTAHTNNVTYVMGTRDA